MSEKNIRLEVMQAIEPEVEGFMENFLIKPEDIWQPTDFLPDSQSDGFLDHVEQLREESKELGYDFWVTMVADTITEEALPTYESWLMDVVGIDQHGEYKTNGWAKWVRAWTAEENRHGDVLNKYLYLSGRVNMKEIEITTLGKMCTIIAGDEMRHHLAYREFVKTIMGHDPNGMMLAFADMMKQKIVMPAHFLRESGGTIGTAFENFSNCAQRLGVYTAQDYIDILAKLNAFWEIDAVRGLNDEAQKARDYLMKLPERLERIASRMKFPEDQYHFKWVEANGRL